MQGKARVGGESTAVLAPAGLDLGSPARRVALLHELRVRGLRHGGAVRPAAGKLHLIPEPIDGRQGKRSQTPSGRRKDVKQWLYHCKCLFTTVSLFWHKNGLVHSPAYNVKREWVGGGFAPR